MLNESPVNMMLLGAISMASVVIGLFFLRFWRDTRDRFFLFFSLSFRLEGLNRIELGLSGNPSEDRPIIYVIRFLSFVLIILGIADKNMRKDEQNTSRSRPAGS